MKSVGKMSIGELGAYVCSHLKKNKINCTLSGGACVSIYSDNAYESFDLDFIETVSSSRSKKRNVLNELGFYEEGRYFRHKETNYFIEFPPGPLGIGEEMIVETAELKFKTGVLKIISATDCVKDRLAGFYHWNDNQCLDQAMMVASRHEVDFDNIEQWSKKEKSLAKYKLFLSKLNNE